MFCKREEASLSTIVEAVVAVDVHTHVLSLSSNEAPPFLV